MSETVKQKILCLSFNQDASCFACGTENGFIIYNSDPVKERFRKDNLGGSIGIVEMLFKSNILALVGSQNKGLSSPNMVMFWDDYQNKFFAELEFKVAIRAVKLKRERVVVVTDQVIYVYSFSDLSVINQHETILNPNGLCSISTDPKNDILVCPGMSPGEVRVDLYDLEISYTLQAHNNELTQLVLNLDGSLLATTSEKGTLVRIWNTETKSMQREFRRGIKEAKIYSLSFSKNSNYLCVCSDTGTIHLYSLNDINTIKEVQEQGDSKIKNKQSKLSFMKGVLPKYFSSEWSFAQFTVPIETNEKYFCAFGESEETIIVITTFGKYYKYQVELLKNQIIPIGKTEF
eukprot:TRINITY_DN12248_c0_g1_i1.p1 TRINITY_DN12248_c0_g1~~TRINITY_DN12248_c0_g1_i1.p1  ORF type:complete len:347 (+),score=79.56 TRINITY_DN12248_c0_g1_i1:6-1046(+)